MYRSKLNELCHSKSWSSPVYSQSKEGPDHNSLFTATVVVNGVTFSSVDKRSSSKLAYNDAAQVAFIHFNESQHSSAEVSSPTSSRSKSSSVSANSNSLSTINVATDPDPQIEFSPSFLKEMRSLDNNSDSGRPFEAARVHTPTPCVIDDKISTDQGLQLVYKSKLQFIAQKRNLTLPVYSSEMVGPPHNPRFKGKVTFDGKFFESSELFKTLKEADHAAAKVALLLLPTNELPEEVEDVTLYRNLLRILVEKKGFGVPKYCTDMSGKIHKPTFVSTVKINEQSFHGTNANMKKLAENSAAKIAYITLTQQLSNTDNNLDSGRPIEAMHVHTPTLGFVDDKSSSNQDLQLVYKSMLQFIAQKRILTPPIYSSEMVGPSHNPRFKGKVTFDGKNFESSELLKTLKEADHAAAKVALLSLPTNGLQEEVEDVAFYRNLLRVLVEKNGFGLPKYCTDMFGEPHKPMFVSTVKINEEIFHGTKAHVKKLAENNAAKVAYITLTQRKTCLGPDVVPPKSQLQLYQSSSLQTTNFFESAPEKIIKEPLKGNIGKELLGPDVLLKSQLPLADSISLETFNDYEKAPEMVIDERLQRSVGNKCLRSDSAAPESQPPFVHSCSFKTSNCDEKDKEVVIEEPLKDNIGNSMKKIVIFPRSSNFTIPNFYNVLAIPSDDWMAFGSITSNVCE